MIRSRNIPPLLSRITGDGIDVSLLVTVDGELLGSSSDATGDQPPAPAAALAAEPSTSATVDPPANNAATTDPNPNAPADAVSFGGLDHASIGSLVAEAAADYHRLGAELYHLDPKAAALAAAAMPTPPTPSTAGGAGSNSAPAGSPSIGPGTGSLSPVGAGVARSSSSVPKKTAGSLRCMIMELDRGTVGVSSAGTDCYVVALAQPTVEHGMLRARVTALSSQVADALSQLEQF